MAIQGFSPPSPSPPSPSPSPSPSPYYQLLERSSARLGPVKKLDLPRPLAFMSSLLIIDNSCLKSVS